MSPSREVDRAPQMVWGRLGLVLGAGFGTVYGLLLGAVTDLRVTRTARG
jgi:hypothetical protein